MGHGGEWGVEQVRVEEEEEERGGGGRKTYRRVSGEISEMCGVGGVWRDAG